MDNEEPKLEGWHKTVLELAKEFRMLVETADVDGTEICFLVFGICSVALLCWRLPEILKVRNERYVNFLEHSRQNVRLLADIEDAREKQKARSSRRKAG